MAVLQDEAYLNGDRVALLVIIAVTLLLLNLINNCLDRGARERPLLGRLAELDRSAKDRDIITSILIC